MKSITKKIGLAGLGAACVLSLSLGTGMLAGNGGIANADEGNSAPNAATYFCDNLKDANGNEYTLAKTFYGILEKLNADGEFKDGVVDYPLNGVLTSEQLKGWVDGGNLDVPKAFSAARDAFITDHPEIFYINFYKLTISVARSNGEYVAYINSGREANLYYDNGFTTLKTVTEAIDKFEAKIDEIVGIVNALEEADVYTARDAFLAKEVNKYLAENIQYDYVAYDNMTNADYVAAAYINTPYGGLVENKAVCGGYATAYKVIMDRLGIPCITVNGYSNNKDENGFNSGSSVYHMWNYVWLETPEAVAAQSKTRDANNSAWYSVDVTWNHSSLSRYRYALLNQSGESAIHVTDGVISSSGYELTYPELSVFNYGSTGETDGLVSGRTYNPTGEKDDYGNELQENYSTVSYNGKSALKLLEEDGLYIAARFSTYDEKTATAAWGKWFAVAPFMEFAELGIDNYDLMFDDSGIETKFYGNTSIYYTQFAVFDIAPDVPIPVIAPSLGIDRDFYYWYSDDAVDNSNPVEVGDMLVNETYGTYIAPPHILTATPSQQSIITINSSMAAANSNIMAESKAFTVEVTYDKPLHILDPSKPIGVSFVSEHPNAQQYAKFFPINANGDLVELVKGEDTDEFNTLRCKFAPSLMFEHDCEGYNIFFSNVGSAEVISIFGDGVGNPSTGTKTSDKQPIPVYLCFARITGVCPARFNYDGRLYIECCAQPTLIADSDLSAMDFVDINGESTFSDDSRRQLMLVAEKADEEVVNDMLDGISNSDEININKEDIKSSETYEISLTLCSQFANIKDGSYIKIALGFPEGYGPEDEGVTFKLFHRKHISGDEYIIEEIPCVVTQFGIVATVTSFSPYMVVAVDADKVTDKTIMASIDGNGGSLTKEDGQIVSLNEGGSYTYTIKPDSGYLIYSVMLNGVDVQDRISNGKLTLGYNELDANNQLVIQYIAREAAVRIQQKIDSGDIDEAVEVGKYIIDSNGEVTANKAMPTGTVSINLDSPNVAVAILIVFLVLAFAVAVVVAVTIVIMRKRKASRAE